MCVTDVKHKVTYDVDSLHYSNTCQPKRRSLTLPLSITHYKRKYHKSVIIQNAMVDGAATWNATTAPTIYSARASATTNNTIR